MRSVSSYAILILITAFGPSTTGAQTGSDPVSLIMPNTWAMPGDTVSIPLSISPVSDEHHIYSMEGLFTYDTGLLKAVRASKAKTITESLWESLITNPKGDSILLAFAGAYTLEGSGALLTLVFSVNPSANVGQTGMVRFRRFMINEGDPSVVTHDAVFTVGEMPSLQLSEDAHDFGTMAIEESANWVFSIANQGAANLIVLDIYAESPSYEVSPLTYPLSLPAGLSQTVEITFKPTTSDTGSIPLRITSNDPQQPIAIITLSGKHETGIEESAQSDHLPWKFGLSQNYPNPFNPVTTISYTIPVQSIKSKVESGEGTFNVVPYTCYVTLKVFNVLGQEVATLVNGLRHPGTYTVTWDANNDSGNELGSGIYFYRLQAGGFTETRRMVYVR